MQVVLVGQLLAGGDIPRRDDPDSPVDVLRLAVRIAAVVDKHRRAEAVDHLAAISRAEQIGDEAVLVALTSASSLLKRGPSYSIDGGAFSNPAASYSSRRHEWTKSESSGQKPLKNRSNEWNVVFGEEIRKGNSPDLRPPVASWNITNYRVVGVKTLAQPGEKRVV